MKCLAVDVETTGLDAYHGCKPYLLTTYHKDDDPDYWECEVDPLTRECRFSPSQRKEIKSHLLDFDLWYFMNPVFDVTAIYHAGMRWIIDYWDRIRDAGLAAHLVDSSNKKKDLTTLVLQYLNIDIKPYEDTVKRHVHKAQDYCRRNLPEWRIASDDDPMLPSGSGWKADMWLLPVLAKHLKYPKDHPWFTVGLDYALADPESTLALGRYLEREIRRNKMWKIYQHRIRLLKVNHTMQFRGISINGERTVELEKQYSRESKKLGIQCTAIAKSVGIDLVLPKSGNNNSLIETVFSEKGFNLSPVSLSKKTQKPELNKKVIETYLAELEPSTKPYRFLKYLADKRSRDTAGTFLRNYQRAWIAAPGYPPPDPITGAGWYVLHPSLNPVGTSTLRWSSSNPNEQNISKKKGFNLRYCFGPAPGREWWSMDAKNIELRIPGYESGEQLLIDLFERPDEPPYYGSEHLLNFSTVYPDIWEREAKEVGYDQVGPHVKKKYADSWYQWCKNGGFAVGYGAVELDDVEGTADKAFHRLGSHSKLRERFAKKEKLNRYWIDYANKHGYVETIPDKFIDPERGYRLVCPFTEYGGVKETIPLNYHVQSTAMQWMNQAMLRCSDYFDELNRELYGVSTIQLLADPKLSQMPDVGYFLIVQVHDEIIFDFPAGKGKKPWLRNLSKIRHIKSLLELGGEGIGIPTPVSVEYHSTSWSEGESIAL